MWHDSLFDRAYRLTGHPGEGGDLPFEGEGLGGVRTVFQSVLVAPRSAACGSVHPTYATPPNRWRSAL